MVALVLTSHLHTPEYILYHQITNIDLPIQQNLSIKTMKSQFQNMSMVPKLSYHHSIFPIGFKIPLIIENKYVKNTDTNIFIYYPKCYFYMEINIHGVRVPNFYYSFLPLIHFKDHEFNTWSLYFQEHNSSPTYSQQFVWCGLFSNLYGCKYLISLIPNTEKLETMNACFMEAAENGCICTVKYLISVDIDMVKYINEALKWASTKGHLDTVRYLVTRGANIHEYDDYDNSALCYAAENGHLDIVLYLVSLGADITDENNYAIRWASFNGHIETVRYLVSQGADITADNNSALCLASRNGHLDIVRYLVSLGADITADNNYAICWAAKNGHFDTVRYLVSQGADITADNNYAIRWAAKNGHFDTVRYLVSQGADITADNNYVIR